MGEGRAVCRHVAGAWAGVVVLHPRHGLPKRLADTFPGAYQFLLNKWYFDELYDAVFVRPAKAIGTFLWKKGDGSTIDGGINGLALGIIPMLTRLAGSRAIRASSIITLSPWCWGLSPLSAFVTLGGGAN